MQIQPKRDGRSTIFGHGAHIGADAFSGAAIELVEGAPFSFGRGLHDLDVDGMLIVSVRDVELNGSAGAVAVEHVVGAALRVDDQGHLDHHQP